MAIHRALAASVLFLALVAAAPKKKTWAIRGVMTDVCQCAGICQFEFDGKPTDSHCDDTIEMTIEKGHYGDVQLDRTKVVVVTRSPEGEKVSDAAGRSVFARIYVPRSVTGHQEDALAALARRLFGKQIGGRQRISPAEEVKRVQFDGDWLEPTHHKLWIAGVLDVESDAVPGKTPLTIRPSQEGYGDITVAKSKVYRFHDGLEWDHSGRSASLRKFDLKGEL